MQMPLKGRPKDSSLASRCLPEQAAQLRTEPMRQPLPLLDPNAS